MSTPKPIFILGSPRSGTTLFSLMLKQQSEIAIPYESHFIVPIVNKWRETSSAQFASVRLQILQEILASRYVREWHPPINQKQIDLESCDNLATLIDNVFMTYAHNEKKQRWADKTPGYLTHADTLIHLFPNSKFIHLVRDGRDASLSLLRTHFGPNNFLSAIQNWDRNVRIARKMLAMLGSKQRMELRYEDLVSEPQINLKTVCDFLEIEFQPEMLENFREDVESRVGDRVHSHHSNLLQPLNASSCYRWKHELGKADQHIAWNVAGNLLTELGYEQGKRCSIASREIRRAIHRCRALLGSRSSTQKATAKINK